MQLGNPSNASADTNNHSHYLIQRSIEALDYNDSRGQANWASWDLTSADANNAVTRQDSYATDTNLPTNFHPVLDTDYVGSGFDRGHLCPSADRTDSTNDNNMTFLMSNMMPQAPDNNRVTWGNFEDHCRTLADAGNEVLIICGPSGFNGSHISSTTNVLIASNTWKIVVVVPLGGGTALSRITTTTNLVIAIRVPNTNGVNPNWTNYVTSAHSIELDTGLTFFTALPGPIASAFRAKIYNLASPPPAITSFTPASGLAGTSAVITGTNFNNTTAVKFNGSNAVYFVDSNTQITATVPTNATTGLITVTTPSGTANSAASFTIAGVTNAPDLSVALSHSSGDTQRDTGDTLTIVISNVGGTASSGAVNVTDILPAGLTATAISGAGWTTNLVNLTATRSDALGAGLSFPSITITVNVASNAPASVTNNVNFGGGGETNLANNSASDVIPIAPFTVGGTNYTGVLAGWNVSGLTDYGPSPFAAASNAPNLFVGGLTRGSGVKTNSSGATGGWGGLAFTNLSAATAIAASQFVTFSLMASNGYKVSYTSLNRFDYRRSGTGPTNSVLQFSVGSGAFTDVMTFSNSSASGGATNPPVDLSGFAALQNVGANTSVTFRLVNYNGGPAGTWYVWDFAASSAPDLALSGTVTPVPPAPTPLQTWRQLWFGTTTNTGTAADTYVGSSDGMANLLKYALGLNPTTATTNPVTGDISTGHLRLTTTRNTNATDVTLSGQVSGNLTTWTTNGTVVDQNGAVFQVHDSATVTGGTNRFMRLRVTSP